MLFRKVDCHHKSITLWICSTKSSLKPSNSSRPKFCFLLPYLGDNWDMELVIVAVAILVILLVAKNGSSKRK